MFLGLKEWAEHLIIRLILLPLKKGLMVIVGGLLRIVEFIYEIFQTLAGATNIFSEATLARITQNVYALFGVIVLFVIAYNFLMYVIDPEKNSGDMSIEKMLKLVIKVIIIIVLLPVIFSFAGMITGSIVEGQVIQKIINGDTQEVAKCDEVKNKGYKLLPSDRIFAASLIDVFASFMDIGDDPNVTNADIKLIKNSNNTYVPGGYDCPTGYSNCTLEDVINVSKCTGKYSPLYAFAVNWHYSGTNGHPEFSFQFIIALLSVAFMAYVMVTFCFDLAVRAIKLAFYQIIAPLCVACMILPGSKKEIYTKWKSLTIKTYTMVFIRILAMELGILLIKMLGDMMDNIDRSRSPYCGGFCWLLVKIFIILGILMFMKQVPKLIDEIIGEESGLASTLKDKIKESGVGKIAKGGISAATAGAAGFKRGIQNFRDKIKKKRDLKNEKRALEGSLASATTDDERNKLKTELEQKKKDLNRARASMLGAFAGIGAGLTSSVGRSLYKSVGEPLKGIKNGISESYKQGLQSAKEADDARKRHDEMNKGIYYAADNKKKLEDLRNEMETIDNNIKTVQQEIKDAKTKEELDKAKEKLARFMQQKENTQMEIDAIVNLKPGQLLIKDFKKLFKELGTVDTSAALERIDNVKNLVAKANNTARDSAATFVDKNSGNIGLGYGVDVENDVVKKHTNMSATVKDSSGTTVFLTSALTQAIVGHSRDDVMACLSEIDNPMATSESIADAFAAMGVDIDKTSITAEARKDLKSAVKSIRDDYDKVLNSTVQDTIYDGTIDTSDKIFAKDSGKLTKAKESKEAKDTANAVGIAIVTSNQASVDSITASYDSSMVYDKDSGVSTAKGRKARLDNLETISSNLNMENSRVIAAREAQKAASSSGDKK